MHPAARQCHRETYIAHLGPRPAQVRVQQPDRARERPVSDFHNFFINYRLPATVPVLVPTDRAALEQDGKDDGSAVMACHSVECPSV